MASWWPAEQRQPGAGHRRERPCRQASVSDRPGTLAARRSPRHVLRRHDQRRRRTRRPGDAASRDHAGELVTMVARGRDPASPTQQFTDRFERIFVPAVLVLVVAVLFAGLVVDEPFSVSFYRAMAVLVAASPCALAIATPSAVLERVARAGQVGRPGQRRRPLENLGTRPRSPSTRPARSPKDARAHRRRPADGVDASSCWRWRSPSNHAATTRWRRPSSAMVARNSGQPPRPQSESRRSPAGCPGHDRRVGGAHRQRRAVRGERRLPEAWRT